ncbi:hypothetical protein R1flu_018018 [Riccia fluitans]|uniref:Plant heme peroxidase family profile domain-containing protein n=1 Tax=Riccia fluitans TaxID=41844 RepID=A0ABD1ZEL6_9MARC
MCKLQAGGSRCLACVALGQKGDFLSLQEEANAPAAPYMTYDQLEARFTAVGLSEQDMVVLSGRVQCRPVLPRLYNYDGVLNVMDPFLDAQANQLKMRCPTDVRQGGFLPMDPTKTEEHF